MKKGWKIFWIVCAVLIVLGGACCVVGVVLGGSAVSVDAEHFPIVRMIKQEYSENRSVYGLHDNGAEPSVSGNVKRYTDIKKLEVEVSSLELNILEYDGADIEVETSDLPAYLANRINYKPFNHGLSIEMDYESEAVSLYRDTEGSMTIRIPKGSLHEVDLSVDGGYLNIEELETYALEIETDMVVTNIKHFTADNFYFSCDGSESDIAGNAKHSAIENGIGAVRYHAAGKETDYNYEIEGAVESISIAGNHQQGGIEEQYIQNPGAQRTMKLECEMGNVDVTFE